MLAGKNPETTSNEKGREKRLARKAFLLPSERKNKDQGGVWRKKSRTPQCPIEARRKKVRA